MLDLDALRGRCRAMATDQLLRTAVVESASLRPEALEVFREVLAGRVGDLGSFFANEQRQMGQERFRIAGVERIAQFVGRRACSDPVDGDLILTTTGLGLLPLRRHRESAVHAMELAHGLAGLLHRWIDEALAAKVDAGGLGEIPLPLLARIWPAASWYGAETIERVKLGPNLLELIASEEREAFVPLPVGSPETILKWASERGLRIERVEPPSLRRWLAGLFRKSDKTHREGE